MKKRLLLVAVALLACLAVVAALFYTGVLQFNHPRQSVRGVDVSHHQGDIDWTVLASQDIAFAFVKATEGSSAVDERFMDNWYGAQSAGLRVGAYHFFSYDSPGAAQADHFIRCVPPDEYALPPVIDVEFYGDYDRHPLPREAVVPQLTAMVNNLRYAYGRAPIIYATEKAYEMYIAGGFEDCDIWIRSVYRAPRLSDGRDWTFWQYSDRTRLKGYSGQERFIDMNVFYGSREAFDQY